MNETMNFEVVASYTRKEAIADGFQVRIPDELRREAGIKYPVFVTRIVWDRYLKVPTGMAYQDMEGRMWDMLFMFVQNAKRKSIASKFEYRVLFLMNRDTVWDKNERRINNNPELREVILIAEVGATDIDDPAPAITIYTYHDA